MYPEYIMKKLRQRHGVKENDASMDHMLMLLSPEIVFKEVCEWEGMIDYGDTIIGWVEDIFNVSLR